MASSLQIEESLRGFSVYIVRCADDTFYTGIAANVNRRMVEHESSPRGAKYLKGRGPLKLVYSKIIGDRSAALRVEYCIKQLKRPQKKALIDGRVKWQDLLPAQDSVSDR